MLKRRHFFLAIPLKKVMTHGFFDEAYPDRLRSVRGSPYCLFAPLPRKLLRPTNNQLVDPRAPYYTGIRPLEKFDSRQPL